MELSWRELKLIAEGLPPNGLHSALFRSRFPRSWWWTPEFDMFSAIQFTGQVANWQRARRGSKPKPLKRPREITSVKTVAELRSRQAAQAGWLAQRRAQKQKQKQQQKVVG